MFRSLIAAFALGLSLTTGSLAQSEAPAGSPHAAQPTAPQATSSPRSSQPTPKLLSAAMASTSPSPREDYAAESTLLALANQSRQQVGAPPLRVNENLRTAARAHALLMIRQQQLSHQFEGEASLLPRLRDAGLALDRAGENVAFNSSPERAFLALMQSPPHRENLLDPRYDTAGFVAVWSDGRLYVVQDFAHQLPQLISTSGK